MPRTKAGAIGPVGMSIPNGNGVSNDAQEDITLSHPYMVTTTIQGIADLLFHRWDCDAVESKAKAAKNSEAKKTDNIESYIYKDQDNMVCLPGEYVRQSIIQAAKFRQDPRSPRKSAMDLFKAGVIALTPLASLGVEVWDYNHKARVTIQRNGVTRVRPAMHTGWEATLEFLVNTPEYINPAILNDVLAQAGRLVGVGDFRPTYGRFQVIHFETIRD